MIKFVFRFFQQSSSLILLNFSISERFVYVPFYFDQLAW